MPRPLSPRPWFRPERQLCYVPGPYPGGRELGLLFTSVASTALPSARPDPNSDLHLNPHQNPVLKRRRERSFCGPTSPTAQNQVTDRSPTQKPPTQKPARTLTARELALSKSFLLSKLFGGRCGVPNLCRLGFLIVWTFSVGVGGYCCHCFQTSKRDSHKGLNLTESSQKLKDK